MHGCACPLPKPKSRVSVGSLHLTFGLVPREGRAKFAGAFSSLAGRIPLMATHRIKLDPEAVEAVARKVVELLEARGLQKRQLVDAATLAQMFGIERSWVYSHAIELGAVKLGSGAKPRLRFDPEIAARVLRKVDGKPTADPPVRSGERAGQPPRRGRSEVRLLPIREPEDEDPPPGA